MPSKWQCSKCDKCFALRRYLQKHVNRAHPRGESATGVSREQRLQCSMCEKCFEYLSHLQRHQLSHLNIREHACPLCRAKFVQKAHLARHLSRRHALREPAIMENENDGDEEGTQQLTDRLPDATSETATTSNHTGIGSTPSAEHRIIFCIECAQQVESHWHLRRHVKAVHRRVFACPQCSLTFNSNLEYRLHRDSHDVNRVFACADCGRRFPRRCDLDVHEKTHSRLGTLLCVVCDAVFVQRVQLDRHVLKEHMRATIRCVECRERIPKAQFADHLRLRQHAISLCRYCGEEDANEEHMRKRHWRRLEKAVPLRLKQKDGCDKEMDDAVLKIVVWVRDGRRELEIGQRLPERLKLAFPGLRDLRLQVVEELTPDTALVLALPVQPDALSDARARSLLAQTLTISFP